MSQPILKQDIESRVLDTGDTMTGSLWFKNDEKYSELYVDSITNYCTYLTYKAKPYIGQIMIQKDNLLFSKYDGTNWETYNILHSGNKEVFRYLGNNILSSYTEDIPSFWFNKGLGSCRFNSTGLILNQPSQYGILLNFPVLNEIMQFWKTQATGKLYVRSDNSSNTAWDGDDWDQIYTVKYPPILVEQATKLATARTIITNLASTSSASFNGTTNITPGVSGILPITNGGTNASTKKAAWSNLIPFYTSPWTETTDDTGANWSSLGNMSVCWWPSGSDGIAGKPASWLLTFTISASGSGSSEMHQLGFSQPNSHIFHRGGNGQSSSGFDGVYNWTKLWQEGDSITSAVWNDYAEYREASITKPGYVLMEKGDDTLIPTEKRLSHFCGVSSDTWGFSQGKTEKAKTPIAVAGRVLVYTYEDRESFNPGDCVCAAPGGTVSKMTRQEIIKWPDRIVGKVSCVPTYEVWGGGESADREPVEIDGRIWIQVK